jgi:hypothetical protein
MEKLIPAKTVFFVHSSWRNEQRVTAENGIVN